MVGAGGVKHQTVIVKCAIYPGPYEACDVHGQHAVVLVRYETEIGNAAVEVPAGRGPGIPGHSAFAPVRSDAVDICCLTGFVSLLIQI